MSDPTNMNLVGIYKIYHESTPWIQIKAEMCYVFLFLEPSAKHFLAEIRGKIKYVYVYVYVYVWGQAVA
jgi:hypothetical protein